MKETIHAVRGPSDDAFYCGYEGVLKERLRVRRGSGLLSGTVDPSCHVSGLGSRWVISRHRCTRAAGQLPLPSRTLLAVACLSFPEVNKELNKLVYLIHI